MKTLFLATAAAATLVALPAQALSVTSTAFSYSQDFDALETSGTGLAWTNDGTLPGWSLFNSALAPVTTYAAGTGSSNTGRIYSFGSADSTERALGGVGSGGFSGWIAVAFTNDSGAALNGFSLRFDGEQWRNGGNTTAQTMVFQYGFGASFATVAAWTAPGGDFDWASPVATSTAAAVDGNAAGLVAARGGSLHTPWAVGDTLWLRWAEVNNTGNDHGLAIDNLQLSVTAVPEPGTNALLLAGLATLGLLTHRRGMMADRS
jgi:hypothetical protein